MCHLSAVSAERSVGPARRCTTAHSISRRRGPSPFQPRNENVSRSSIYRPMDRLQCSMKLATQISRPQPPKFLSMWEHERPSGKTKMGNIRCVALSNFGCCNGYDGQYNEVMAVTHSNHRRDKMFIRVII
jgi:hypothetical protein